jgi:hypothetical protein
MMVVSVVIMEKLQLITFVEILPGLNPQNIKLFTHVHYTYKKSFFYLFTINFLISFLKKNIINMFLSYYQEFPKILLSKKLKF